VKPGCFIGIPGDRMRLSAPENKSDWDVVIQPGKGLFDLQLRELWRYRDLITLMVRRDFVSKFKQTILGPAWFIFQPLLSTIMFTIVFGNIAQLSTDGLPKMLFYLSGNVLWLYFSNCLTLCSTTFIDNAHLFGKVYFSRLVVPVSIVISQAITLALQFLFFLCFMGYFMFMGADIRPNMGILLFPALFLLMAGMSLGLGIIFSSMTTKYRDMRFLLDFGVRLLMFATTAIYPLSSIPEKYRLFILSNPMTPIIEAFRYGFMGQGAFSWAYLGYSAGFTAIVLFIGMVMFTRIERTFMDTV
jgi:lipopolysaccharide transport system permease protein